MITEAVLDWFATFVAWVGGLLTLPSPPAFFATLQGYVTTAGSYVASTGAWLPWSVMGTVLTAFAACLLAALAIKVVRIAASFLTAGGGSAA